MNCLQRCLCILLLALLSAPYAVVSAGPARPLTAASLTKISATETNWVAAQNAHQVVFRGADLYFAVQTRGLPDYWNQKVLSGGVEAPDVTVVNFHGDGADNYSYEIRVPSRYAKNKEILLPIRGKQGGERLIRIPPLNIS